MMIRRLNSLFLVFVALVALPEFVLASNSRRVECAQLLAAIDAEIQLPAKLSDPAQAYVRLVNHYMKQAPGAESDSLLSEIIESSQLVNPFANKTGSLAVQVSNAIKSVYSKITQQDWSLIRIELIKLQERSKAESTDRNERKEQTRKVFSVEEIFNKNFNSVNHFEVYTLEGRTFVLLATDKTSDGRLYLYEFISNDLVLINSMKLNDNLLRTSKLEIVNGRLLFTVYIGWFTLRVIEIVDGQFKQIQDLPMLAAGRPDPKWRFIDSEVFLSFGNKDLLQLYELSGDSLNLVNQVKLEEVELLYSAWNVADGTEYLSFSTQANDNGTGLINYLFEIKDKKFILKDKKVKSENTFPRANYRKIFGDTDVVSGGYEVSNSGFVFYKIQNGMLTPFEVSLSDMFLTKDNMIEAPFSTGQIECGSAVYITKEDGSSFRITSKVTNHVSNSTGWQLVDESLSYVRIGSHDSITFGEYANEIMYDKSSLKLNGARSIRWLNKDGNYYVFVSTLSGLKIFKVYKRLE